MKNESSYQMNFSLEKYLNIYVRFLDNYLDGFRDCFGIARLAEEYSDQLKFLLIYILLFLFYRRQRWYVTARQEKENQQSVV